MESTMNDYLVVPRGRLAIDTADAKCCSPLALQQNDLSSDSFAAMIEGYVRWKIAEKDRLRNSLTDMQLA